MPTGRLAAPNQLRLAIGLSLRDPAGLDRFLQRLCDPASPEYRQYLRPEQVAARFGPTVQDYEAVKTFAHSNGLTITGTYTNRLLLDVVGPASAVERAFHLTLRTYRHPTEAREFSAPDTEPAVDGTLPVADIQGLSDYARPHPKLGKRDHADTAPKAGSAPDNSGNFFGNDFRNAYAPGVTLTGAGQTIGFVEFDGFYPNDIAAYATAAGDGRADIVIETILLDGYNGLPTGNENGNAEVSLDIEMAMSMAPGLSKIVSFEAGPNGLPNDILNSMLTFSNSINQLSCSWAWGGGPSTTTDNIFKSMAAAGMSFFNASGDSDAFTTGAGSINGVDNPELTNAPSSSPYLTQVGGTALTMNGTGASYASETAWNQGDGTGTSGGISSYYAIPNWQTNVSMTFNGGSTNNRNTPDVAMSAAKNMYIVLGGQGLGSDGWGGTSFAAPLWAGFTALMNQQALGAGRPPVGFINPAIYSLAAGPAYANCFHDITTGSNTWSGSPDLFYATNGYDLCTGLGTPTGQPLIDALAGPAQSLDLTPRAGFTASGPLGGPFSGSPQVFTLTNSGASSITWSVINTSAWLNVSPANGTLPAWGQTPLTVNLTSAAASLGLGTYAATVLVTNVNGGAMSLPAALQVKRLIENGGFETGDFTGWTLNGSTRLNLVTSNGDFVHSGSYAAALGQSPSLGFLSQTLTTLPGQLYLLSFWLDNPTNSGGATPNQFLVQWNGITVFNQTNIPFTSWTNVQLFVTAASLSTVLAFGFEDTPDYLGLDDIRGMPVPLPAFYAVQTTLGGLRFTWNTITGLTYQVQYKTNLFEPNWIVLGVPLVATGTSLTFADTNVDVPAPARFYRLMLSP